MKSDILFGLLIPFLGTAAGAACVLFMKLFLGLVGAAFYEELMNPTMPAPGAQNGGELKVCPSCGAAVEKGNAFCPQCGNKMPEE